MRVMFSDEDKRYIKNLWHLAHLNTYLDLNNESNQSYEIPIRNLKYWSISSRNILNLIERQDKIIKQQSYTNKKML